MPPFAFHLFCCTNRRDLSEPRGSCAAKGSEELRDYMKARVKELGIPSARVNAAGCLDMCERGPVIVVYPEGIWYRVRTEADVKEIMERHIVNGEPVERLLMPDQARPSLLSPLKP